MLEEKQHYKDTARLVSDHLTLHSLLTLSVSQYPPIRDAQRISQQCQKSVSRPLIHIHLWRHFPI